MYKNDLAFVEREGLLEDHTTEEQQLELLVRSKVKDLVVSTLSVNATTGSTTTPTSASASASANVAGRPNVTIKYDNETTPVEEEPLFNFRYGADGTLGNLLASVVGAGVELEIGGGTSPTTKGTVLLVEKKQQVIDGTAADPQLESQWSAVQLLCSTGQIRRVPLNSVVSAKLLDPELQQQLVASLQRRLASAMPKKKPPEGMTSIDIVVPSPSTPGTVQVSHLDTAEEWKCLYRLEISAEQQQHPQQEQQPEQQTPGSSETTAPPAAAASNDDDDGYIAVAVTDAAGTATASTETVELRVLGSVRNTGNEDWNNVQVSLVANEIDILEELTATLRQDVSAVKKLAGDLQ